MKCVKRPYLHLGLITLFAVGSVSLAQGPATKPPTSKPTTSAHPTDAELSKTIVAFVNRTLGYKGLDAVTVKSVSAPDASGLRTAVVHITKGEQADDVTYYITADDKEIIEGQKDFLSADPYATVRSKLQTQGFPTEGPAGAPVTIVEFSDLQCPYCKQANQAIHQIMQQEPGRIRVVFKYYPMTHIHPWGMESAIAGYCVAAQSPEKFWSFAQAVFDQQEQLEPLSPDAIAPRLHDFAVEAGTQDAAYNTCIHSPASQAAVDASMKNGDELGVSSTPTMFINGRLIGGMIPVDALKAVLDNEAKISTQLAAGSKIDGQQCGECTPLPPPPVKH